MATSTYDPYNAVKMIYGLKNDWDNYHKTGDTANKNKTTESAQKYYQELMNNGYANTADELSKSNYANSKKIYDKYATAGKTPMNSYLGSLGSSYGLSQAQIDALISTNPAGEVSFGGKNVGTPYSNVDGVMYGDAATWDGVWNDYVGRSGIQKTLNDTSLFNKYTQYSDENRSIANDILNRIAGNNDTSSQNTTNRINNLWGTIEGDKANLTADYTKLKDFNYSNPFTTETGKSVLERYDLAALQGRDNEAAAGGANNSGNIDSYSAANALRQQASLRNLGEQSALAAHDRTVNSGRSILSDQGNYYSDLYNRLGGLIDTEANANSARNKELIELYTKGYIEPTQQFHDNMETTMGRLYNQGETSRLNDLYIDEAKKNGQVSRDSQRATDSGYVQNNQLSYQFGFTDENGNVRDKNTDFQSIINYADEGIAKSTDPNQRQFFESMKSAAAWARDQKQIQYPEYQVYGKSAGNYAGGSTPTLANQQGRSSVGLESRKLDLTEKELDASIDLNNANLDWQKEYGRLEIDYKNKGLTREATNFALGIERDLKIADLNASVAKDANQVDRYKAELNVTIAKIDAESKKYSNDTSYQSVLAQLKQNGEQFYAELEQRATEFNASNQLETKKFEATNGSSNSNYQPSMDWDNLANKIAIGNYATNVKKDWEAYFGQTWNQDAAKFSADMPDSDMKKWAASGYDLSSAVAVIAELAAQGITSEYITFDEFQKLIDNGTIKMN